MARTTGPHTIDVVPPSVRSGPKELERYRQKRYDILTGEPGIARDVIFAPAEPKTGDYTMRTTDYTLVVDASAGPVTITLPSAADTSGPYGVKKTDDSVNFVTVAPPSGETIDRDASFDLECQDESVTVEPDGTNWWIV